MSTLSLHTFVGTLSAAAAPLQEPHAPRDDLPAANLLSSQDLLQGNRSVEIMHNGSIYRLYATRLGKLILTK